MKDKLRSLLTTAIGRPTSATQRSHVFISYSHKDDKWVPRLHVHLDPLISQYGIEIFDYKHIRPGTEWREYTEESIDSARVAILLVSADFIASDFIKNNELPQLLNAARKKGMTILPIIVNPSSFSQTELANFQTVNNPTSPLTGLSEPEQEVVFLKVAAEVEHAFKDSSSNRLAGSLSLKSKLVIVALLIALTSLIVVVVKFKTATSTAPQTATATPQPSPQAKAELSGTVFGNEKPLQGARVTLDDLPAMSPVETSSDGVFNLRDIPRNYGDGVRVRVVMEGYRPNPYTEDVVLGKAPPRIKLTKVR